MSDLKPSTTHKDIYDNDNVDDDFMQDNVDIKKLDSWSNSLRKRANKYKEKLLHNKFAITSKFVVCSKVLSDSIPSRNCDVLATLPPSTSNEVIMWVVTRIRTRTPELILKLKMHAKSGDVGLYLTASQENLMKGTEELGFRKTLKSAFGGGVKEFVYEERNNFEGADEGSDLAQNKWTQALGKMKGSKEFEGKEDGGRCKGGGVFMGGGGFLKSEERQSIVHYMLMNLRAVEGDEVAGVKFHSGQAIVPILLSRGIISQVFPLHNHNDLAYLRSKWVKAFFHKQPLDRICDYYGVKIALYFAYLGHYTRCLVWPAFIGVVLWLFSGISQFADDAGFVLFAMFNVIWATLYLEGWKRQASVHAYHWNTMDKEDELLLEPRSLFHGDMIYSRVTGRLEATYPGWKRNLFKCFVSYPIIVVCLSLVFGTVWVILELQGWVNVKVGDEKVPYFFKFAPKILLALCISLLDEAYKRIATWLNDRENYRLNITYEKHLILKLVMFQFVNSFLSLFYIAFYLQNMTQLQEHLAALLITRQVIGNLKETIQPFIIEKLKLFRTLYAKVVKMDVEEFEEMMKSGDVGKGASEGKCRNNDLINKIYDEKGIKFDEDDDSDDSSCDKGGQLVTEIKRLAEVSRLEKVVECDMKECSKEKAEDEGGVSRGGCIKHISQKNGEDDDGDEDSIDIRSTLNAFVGGSFTRDGYQGNRRVSMMLDVGQQLEGLRGKGSGKVSRNKIGQAEVESFMKRYEDTYEDYLEMFIQFGYVTLFSSAFPLAALCALLNNVIEIRSDAFKLCVSLQRPFGQRVENIGIWQPALEMMSMMAIMVNSALIGMSGLAERLFPGWGTAERIVSIVILEHLVMALRMLVAYAIPDVPEEVAEERARLEFMRREAFKKQKKTTKVFKE